MLVDCSVVSSAYLFLPLVRIVGLANSAPAPVAVCVNLIFRVRVETFRHFQRSLCVHVLVGLDRYLMLRSVCEQLKLHAWQEEVIRFD
jgi:hypothetical protein